MGAVLRDGEGWKDDGGHALWMTSNKKEIRGEESGDEDDVRERGRLAAVFVRLMSNGWAVDFKEAAGWQREG